MKKSYLIVLIIAVILVAALIIVPLVIDEPSTSSPDPEIPDAADYADRDITGRNIAYVTMTIKDYGEVKLLLDATSAPRTVANFLTLAKSGFYDGTDFCSAMQLYSDASIILGGDPTIDGGEAAPDTVKGEFAANGIENDLPIKRGAIVMLYSDTPDDARSRFFFTSGNLPDHDGYLAPFGYITSGYKILDQIINDAVYYSDTYGVIEDGRRPIISSVTIEQDIDYSLVSDVYLTPPAAEDISSLLGVDNEAKRISIMSSYASILRAYSNGETYLLQLTGKLESKTANILISVDSDGKILGANALAPTADGVDSQLSALIGLDRETVATADIADELRSLASDALCTVSEFSSCKYFYDRDITDRETYTVEMKVEGYDTPVVILLDKTTAPITVENFLSLVNDGFYDGLIFHRIIKGFMIQGGSFTEAGASKDSETIKGEFSSNGHENDIKHLRGVISMARATDPDSASSGFFICDADSDWLDGEYAAFGYVISGMETVDAIADYSVGKTDSSGNLYSDYDPPVIEYIKLIEN